MLHSCPPNRNLKFQDNPRGSDGIHKEVEEGSTLADPRLYLKLDLAILHIQSLHLCKLWILKVLCCQHRTLPLDHCNHDQTHHLIIANRS